VWLCLTSFGVVAGFWFGAQAGDAVSLPLATMITGIGVITGALAVTAVVRPAVAARSARSPLSPSAAH
jgi:hypothetical protein